MNTHGSWRNIEVLWSETFGLCKKLNINYNIITCNPGFPVAQMVEHGASNAKIMGSIPRESKSWSNVKL